MFSLRPLAVLLVLSVVPAFPQQSENQLDSNETLFTVLAAVNAAGYDAELDSPSANPLRKQVRSYVATQKVDCLYDLQRFVNLHKQKNPSAELSQYISYALAIGPPPMFAPRYQNNLMPPDAAQLDGFTPLLISFYRQANIADLWKRSQPAFDKVIGQYHEPVTNAVLAANAYARNPTNGFLGHRFQIYIDLLGAPNQVQMRNYADDSFVVVTSSIEPRTQDIRHAYLHYLLDPLGLKYSKELTEKSALGEYALNSPILAEQYRLDFVLLATECFIKAVESRIDKNPAMALQAAKEGFVLTPAFAEILAQYYEKQEAPIRLVFPDLIAHIDLKREAKRFDNFQFASEASGRTVHLAAPKLPELTGAELTLDQAEKNYTARNLADAKNLYLNVLTQTPVKSLHAKAYYGLARIAVLERNPEEADKLFQKVLDFDPDSYTKSWSLLYLARLNDAQPDGRADAEKYYKAALAVPGVPDSVREAAEKGLKQAFEKK